MNPQLLRDIFNFGLQGEGRENLFNARSIIDGTLFSLPGGDVKLAVGYEYIHSGFDRREVTAVRNAIDRTPFAKYSRRVHSIFGETQIPIFGADNRIGGIYSLLISGSVRYDHYSDFGSTTNPKIGATYKPVSWLGIRGNWGTSFNAPAPVDQLRATTPAILPIGIAAFVRPGDVIPGGQFGVATVGITGSTTPLQRQTADTWSVGIDVDPPFLEGLRASLSYYNVKFENILATPTPGSGIFANFPGNVMTRLPTAAGIGGFTPAEVRAFIAPFAGIDPAGALAAEQLLTTGRPVYLLVDFRTGNYGNRKVEGLDFNVSYRRSTGFGGIDASVSGDYALSRKSAPSAGAPTIDELTGLQNGVRIQDDTNRLLLQATLGADIGAFRAQATLNHSSGFDILPIAGDVAPRQTRVKAYDTVNLFFKYDVPGESMLLRDLSFTLNVNNVFDQDPPEVRRSGGDGFANGFTLGRLVMFGVSKQF
jgi:iron complex outermembrane recepter protein